MGDANTVTFYLHPKLRRQAERGTHNFIRKIGEVLTGAGLSLAYDDDDDVARLRAMVRPGRGLFLMDEPPNDRCLTFRKTYIYPFWHIEKQGKRWDWPVAKTAFDPATQNSRKAANFQRFWRNRLFDQMGEVLRDGFVYVPLQGRLTSHRSFQYCSPIKMIEAILEHEPDRKIIATMHPSETYEVDEHKALEDLLDRHDQLYLQPSGTEDYLRNCDYIVTQNSSVGFLGYFFDKPLILFGQIDFYHIALNVHDMGVAAAFDAVEDHAPDYAAYLHWFLQENAINAGRPEAHATIREVLANHGWPV